MALGITLKDHFRETEIFLARAFFAGIVAVGLFVAVISRLVYLQIVKHDHYTTLSQANRIHLIPVPPNRGLILDRDGVVLAQNFPSFQIHITPERVGNLKETLERLATVIDLQDIDIARFRKQLKRSRAYQTVPLRFRLSDEEVARFALDRHLFPGVELVAPLTRHYPHGEMTSHVVGYVGRIDDQEQAALIDESNYEGTTHIGKTGLEKQYEDVLHGFVGNQEAETNAQGRMIRVLKSNAPTPGVHLHLNLSANLQKTAIDMLGERNGSVVAIDPKTGGVLALVSKPGFDPNLFVNGIDSDVYKALLTSPDQPLYNRSVNGQYPPGSTIKPFYGLAALEYNMPEATGVTSCRGAYSLPGDSHRYRDWKKEGHGAVDLDRAITESCDVYFYDLANSMGVDRMSQFLGYFGFGTRTGLDIPNEFGGLLPSRAWKRAARKENWYAGETVVIGIGQGYLLVTPTQMASFTGMLAARGQRMVPRLVQSLENPNTSEVQLIEPHRLSDLPVKNPLNYNKIIEAMTHVVHGPRGTAKSISKDLPYTIGGKTGTAQVFQIKQDEKYKESEVPEKLRDHAWFIAFAPAEDPKIAVCVLVENGGHGGSAAAPIARKVMDAYLLGQPAT
jgi:penicillin-binding protein 2